MRRHLDFDWWRDRDLDLRHDFAGQLDIAGAAFVVRGLVSLRSSWTAAYRWFRRGLLVWILITQVFVFYSSQLAGIGGLIVNLIVYSSLRFAHSREIAAGRSPQGAASRRG